MSPDIFSWVKSQEARFETDEVKVGDNWSWNFKKHVQLLFHLKNGIFYTGENDWLRAFKNIMEPIIELADWMEDIELKDIVFYIENSVGKVLSFLFKKYHDEVYVKENNVDTLIDQITESDNAYGGVLLQKGKMPEVFELNSIAFCDQTDIMGGPIVFKHSFSPDKLRTMSSAGWGKESMGATISLEDLITLATYDKSAGLGQKNETPGKTIEVYVLRGNLPQHYLNDDNDMENFYNQVQILAYYTDSDKKKNGVCLYRKKEAEGNIKFHTSKEVYGRALGRGVGERMLHPQIWTNFLEIHKMGLLESASKTPLYTDDPAYTERNKIQDMENLEITTIDEGKRIFQVPTAAPANLQLLSGAINEWYSQAQLAGSAFDPVLGVQPASGTTFRGQERVVQQGTGSHLKRKGQRAKFIEEIYRDWIIPDIKKQILKGKQFMATLNSEELSWMSDQLAENDANRQQMEMVLNGQLPPDGLTFKDHKDQLKQQFLADFSKKGNKHFLQILEGEFQNIEVKIGINVANKQKDLSGMSDKLLSIFQSVIANPQGFLQAMKIPAMSEAFSNILEFSGLSIADFNSLANAPDAAMQPTPSPLQAPQMLAAKQ